MSEGQEPENTTLNPKGVLTAVIKLMTWRCPDQEWSGTFTQRLVRTKPKVWCHPKTVFMERFPWASIGKAGYRGSHSSRIKLLLESISTCKREIAVDTHPAKSQWGIKHQETMCWRKLHPTLIRKYNLKGILILSCLNIPILTAYFSETFQCQVMRVSRAGWSAAPLPYFVLWVTFLWIHILRHLYRASGHCSLAHLS